MSNAPTIVVAADAAAATNALANLVVEAAVQAVNQRGRFHLCATGGSTPAALYQSLRAPESAGRMPWKATHIWFGDDRHVPRSSPLSNLAAVDSILLATTEASGVSPITPEQIHAWPTESDGPSAVSNYLARARHEGIEHTADGVPIFDLVLIGVGSDTHCLSVFPGSPLAAVDAPVAAPVPSPAHIEPHVPRLSFSLRIIGAARAVCAIALGEGKRYAVARILQGDEAVRDVPAKAALIPTATWIIDQAAASELAQVTER
jgi:6-phosphogluconolactonase